MTDKIDLATKEIRGVNRTHIIWLVSCTASIVFVVMSKLNTIETKIDIAHIEQIYQHRNDSLQNHNIEKRLDFLERKPLNAMILK